jgi:hypothetical protein
MEGVPMRYIAKPPEQVPAYMGVCIAALSRALLRARINVFAAIAEIRHVLAGTWKKRSRRKPNLD